MVGRRVPDPGREEPDGPAPPSLRELAFIDRINEVREPQQASAPERLPRLYDEDYAILALLDRAGLVLPSMIGRAVLPGKEPKTVRHRLNKLYEHGLVARAGIGVRERSSTEGRLPWLYTLTRRGLEVAQQRKPPAIHPQREWRALEQRRAGTLPHNLHALSWAIELHRIVGEIATDYWRTPRYATGRYPVPQTGGGHKRHPITMRELDVPDGHAILDLPRVPRDQARPLARTTDPEPQAHVRPARRARPHRPALLQPREVPRLRRLPHRLGARPSRATGRSEPARSPCSCAPTHEPRSPTPQRPTAR